MMILSGSRASSARSPRLAGDKDDEPGGGPAWWAALSVQPEFRVDRLEFRWLDEPRMRHRYRMKQAV